MLPVWSFGIYLVICFLAFWAFVLWINGFKKAWILEEKFLHTLVLILMVCIVVSMAFWGYFLLTGTYGPNWTQEETIIYL